ncbi:MAG: sensor histidine kinase [Leptothrix sp. (in: Bacteria)]|nr:sensor histidine kinase [Leptothrix sp. (in: b-proteobacteria)]
MTTPAPTEPDFEATATRPASLWPDSARPSDMASTGFAATRFDPLADERGRLQAQVAASFDVCHPALALRAVLLVQGALAIAALGGADTVAAWGARQAVLAFGGVAGTLLWLVAVCALRRPLRALGTAARAAAVLALGAAAALLAWWPLAWAGLAGEGHALKLAAVGLGGVGFAALLWAWLDLRARIWHPANASARLAELQSRIRPHFLFNALNTALALVRVDPARAEAVLEDLAELFRVALAEVGASVSLQEEVELARHYLGIEQVRFGPRLAVTWDIDPRVHAARVPPLVLQPLVENAVRHGIEPAARGGSVQVTAVVQRAQAVVTVTNTLASEPGQPGHGMALHNVRERLRLLHDVGAQCDAWREPGSGGEPDRFHARIVLPLP